MTTYGGGKLTISQRAKLALYHQNPNRMNGSRLIPQPSPEAKEVAPVTDYGSAMRSMINRAQVDSVKYRDQLLRADRAGAAKEILEFEKRLVTWFQKQGIPLFTHCLWRGEAEQNGLAGQGHSKAFWGSSPHNYGMAIDVIHSIHAWNLDRKAWDLIGHRGKEIAVQSGIAITWGGDWKFYDPAHWELKEWKLAKAIRRPGQRFPANGEALNPETW